MPVPTFPRTPRSDARPQKGTSRVGYGPDQLRRFREDRYPRRPDRPGRALSAGAQAGLQATNRFRPGARHEEFERANHEVLRAAGPRRKAGAGRRELPAPPDRDVFFGSVDARRDSWGG